MQKKAKKCDIYYVILLFQMLGKWKEIKLLPLAIKITSGMNHHPAFVQITLYVIALYVKLLFAPLTRGTCIPLISAFSRLSKIILQNCAQVSHISSIRVANSLLLSRFIFLVKFQLYSRKFTSFFSQI